MGFLESLDRLDREAFLAVAGQGDAAADAVFTVVSSGWVALAFWATLWFIRGRQPEQTRRDWLWLLVAMLAAFAAADWVASFIKDALARPRPCWDLEGQFRAVAACKGRYGLVSGHAATTAAVATVFLRSKPALVLALPAVVWVLAVALSRVYLGVHYPGDVFGGAVVGVVVAKLLLAVRDRGLPKQ